MAYNIIRNTRTGYVSMVEKGRDSRGNVKTKAYICGLGNMSIEAFKRFQAWAHGMKNQEDRKAAVLGCKLAVTDDTTKESRKGVKSKIEPVRSKKSDMFKEKESVKEKRITKPMVAAASGEEAIRLDKIRLRQIKERKEAKEIAKSVKPVDKPKRIDKSIKQSVVKRSEKQKGLNLSMVKTVTKKRSLINERIKYIEKQIEYRETEKRITDYSYFGVTKTRKLAEHNQYIDTAKKALKMLKKQRSELRR